MHLGDQDRVTPAIVLRAPRPKALSSTHTSAGLSGSFLTRLWLSGEMHECLLDVTALNPVSAQLLCRKRQDLLIPINNSCLFIQRLSSLCSHSSHRSYNRRQLLHARLRARHSKHALHSHLAVRAGEKLEFRSARFQPSKFIKQCKTDYIRHIMACDDP